MERKAVTFGRFNTFSRGHESFIQSILLEWSKVSIGVIENNPITVEDNLFANFIKECDRNYIKPLNKIQHRMNLMELILDEKNFLENCSIIKINRPELYPEKFNEMFPKNVYDVVFAIDTDSQFDIKKIGIFELLLNRPIKLVKPDKIIHSSDIIKMGIEEIGFSRSAIDYCQKHGIPLGGEYYEK
ncbi:hypothetical protein [Listeria kieliensis]|uniref:Cytidyltransferase-like domain-containing protein n=1 Tax=Listeria kieliensis TaxID=1621700 RepID=A0A3D8TRT9_9LIST|nr:hypothetical protein [Listeria kieliensis]RDX01324.1 hypothetical protein UR08_10420 [Listeria kieliensis]